MLIFVVHNNMIPSFASPFSSFSKSHFRWIYLDNIHCLKSTLNRIFCFQVGPFSSFLKNNKNRENDRFQVDKKFLPQILVLSLIFYLYFLWFKNQLVFVLHKNGKRMTVIFYMSRGSFQSGIWVMTVRFDFVTSGGHFAGFLRIMGLVIFEKSRMEEELRRNGRFLVTVPSLEPK